MNRIRWFPVGPHTKEATHGPLLARLVCEEPSWWQMRCFRGGEWTHTVHAARANLKRTWREMIERYELERDRDRLDWLEAGGTIHYRSDMSNLNIGTRRVGRIRWAATLREAIDAAREAEGSG